MDPVTPKSNDSGVSPGGLRVILVCSIFLPFAIAAVILRLWARRLKKLALCLNDYLILLALLFEVGNTATIIIAVTKGKVGYHLLTLTPSEITALSKSYLAAEPLWISVNTCVKLSIMHLYIQIFRVRSFRMVVYGGMALVVAYWFSTIVRMFFLCTPFAYSWDKTIPDGSCVNLLAAYLSVSVINLILDVMVIVMPMPMLWSLQMPTAKKVAISAIFSIGALICVVTILRIVAVSQLDLMDLSYSAVNDGIWSDLEPCLGIVNACLPVLQPAFAKLFKSGILSSMQKPTSANSRHAGWSGSGGKPQVLRSLGSGESKTIQPDEDVYPLTDHIPDSRCTVRTSEHGLPMVKVEDLEAQVNGGSKRDTRHDIKITREWEVRSGEERAAKSMF